MISRDFEVYTAESKVKEWRKVFKAMLAGLIRGRHLAYRLSAKEVKAEYAQARFGMLWDFLEPVVVAIVFVILRQGRVIDVGAIDIPYAVFVIYGVLLWQTFAEALTQPLTIMQRSKTLVTQVKVPSEALWLSIFFKILFHSGFRIVVMFGISLVMGTLAWVGFLKFLLLYPSVIFLGLAFGILLAPFNVIYSDVGRVINISMRPLLYIHPIIFYAPTIPLLAAIYAYSPIAIIIANLRSLATQNLFLNLPAFGLTCVGLAVVFLVGWFIFHLSVPILSDKL